MVDPRLRLSANLSRRRFLSFMIMAGSAAVLGACGGEEGATTPETQRETPTGDTGSPAASPETGGTGQEPTGEPIKIGAAVSTTGNYGRTGQYQQEAYLLWEEQINQNGGLLGRPVQMVIYDDQSVPDTGARLYERLITEDQVDLVLGPYSSAVTQAVAQVIERHGYPMIAAGASAREIWERGYKNVFGVYSVAQDYFKSIIRDIAAGQGYKTAAVIYGDSLFPTSTANGALEHCEAVGIEVVLEEKYPAQPTDLSSVLTQVRDSNPDILIGGSYLPDSVLIMRQSKDLGVNVKLFAFSVGAAQPDFGENLGADANWALGPSMWEPNVQTPGNEEFVQAYQAKWDREPDYHSADGYAACQVLQAAIEQVGEVDREGIRNALLELQMPTVLPGKYQVNENGMAIGHIPLAIQWQEGQKVIVAPEDLAEGQVQLPTPPWNERG